MQNEKMNPKEDIQMTPESMQKMLDLTYEMEGLLQLALSREDSPSRIFILLKSKLNSINALWQPEQPEHSQPSAPSDSSDTTDNSDSSDISNPSQSDLSFESYDLDDDEPLHQDKEESPQAESEIPVGQSGDLSVGEQSETDLPIEPPVVDQVVEQSNPVIMHEETIVSDSKTLPKTPQPKVSGAPVFSLNDRFLYSRELFGGRVADFEAALKEVAAMERYEEAEEYFFTEWNFDMELPVVQNFMAVISNYFA